MAFLRDLDLADRWQRGFPLCPNPFAVMAHRHGITEKDAIMGMTRLQQNGAMSRIGAVVRPNSAGASTLAAIACPPAELENIAAIISAEHYVNHNYERDHHINLWFVVAAPSSHDLDETLKRIGQTTGRALLDLRLEKPYHIDLGFPLAGRQSRPVNNHAASRSVTRNESRLLAVMEDGLPLTARPYDTVARALGWSEDKVIELLDGLIGAGIITRLGCVLKHRELGFNANAMAVWNVPDSEADKAGYRLAERPAVTLCYRRRRSPPSWPYNLYAMVHGRDAAAVAQQVEGITVSAGLSLFDRAILFSRRCFTQRGARFSRTEEARR